VLVRLEEEGCKEGAPKGAGREVLRVNAPPNRYVKSFVSVENWKNLSTAVHHILHCGGQNPSSVRREHDAPPRPHPIHVTLACTTSPWE